jgi:hypothetical protein
LKKEARPGAGEDGLKQGRWIMARRILEACVMLPIAGTPGWIGVEQGWAVVPAPLSHEDDDEDEEDFDEDDGYFDDDDFDDDEEFDEEDEGFLDDEDEEDLDEDDEEDDEEDDDDDL